VGTGGCNSIARRAGRGCRSGDAPDGNQMARAGSSADRCVQRKPHVGVPNKARRAAERVDNEERKYTGQYGVTGGPALSANDGRRRPRGAARAPAAATAAAEIDGRAGGRTGGRADGRAGGGRGRGTACGGDARASGFDRVRRCLHLRARPRGGCGCDTECAHGCPLTIGKAQSLGMRRANARV